MTMVTEIEPCEKCRKKYLSKGVMLIEATTDEKGKIYPTGRLSVIKNEAYNKIFNIPAPKKIVYIEPEAYERIGLHKEPK